MEKTLWKLAFGRFARVVLTEMKGKRVVTTFPISLHRSRRVVKTKNSTEEWRQSHHSRGRGVGVIQYKTMKWGG